MSESPDDPIVPYEEGWAGAVVDLAGYKISRGRSTTPERNKCKHRNLVYSTDERRIWCDDCRKSVDAFDAFTQIARGLAEMQSAADSQLAEARDAMRSSAHRRAAKALDRAWHGGNAVVCPHCRHGLLPEDFERYISSISGDLERARRAKVKADKAKTTTP